jgi:hypothetical protein
MPSPKSLLRPISIDVAGNSHNCQHNESHRIQKGHRRLKIKRDGASPEHFCLKCALESVAHARERLVALEQEILTAMSGQPGVETSARRSRPTGGA